VLLPGVIGRRILH